MFQHELEEQEPAWCILALWAEPSSNGLWHALLLPLLVSKFKNTWDESVDSSP